MMLLTLEKYFLEYGHLIIPGIGQLSFVQKDASHSNGQFYPPNEIIQFEYLEASNTKPSKLFYIYLSDQLDCSVEQAMIDYSNFFQKQLISNNTIELGNLGQLKLENSVYTYHSNFNSNNYYQDLNYDKVLTENQNENNFNTSNNKWWILPLIIGVFAIIAILFKFK
jgi:hypothetical protein